MRNFGIFPLVDKQTPPPFFFGPQLSRRELGPGSKNQKKITDYGNDNLFDQKIFFIFFLDFFVYFYFFTFCRFWAGTLERRSQWKPGGLG